ncbi:glycosyltransferase [Aeromonas caviae]|uniref:glycosyltransferase n=1 Tax=Aeromonas caviae TaxID=648 RepID=UPI002B46F1E1|nr:glycosyltransferase [Aeromonas caviae]
MKNKYLILSNSLAHGGGERIAANIINGLNAANESVASFIIENEIAYHIDDGIRVYVQPIDWKIPILGKLLNNITSLIYLIYIIKKNNVNVVISHLFRSNYLNVIASFITGHKVVITTHGSISKYMNRRVTSRINLLLIKTLFKKADKKVFLTERMKDDYIPYVGEYNNVVIPNCYDLKSIEKSSLAAVSDNPFNANDYFVFVGRFHPVKRVDLILDVASKLNINLLLLGDGGDYEKLSHLYSGEKIVFLGSRSNPYPYMKNARAIILASESEGFPNVIVEALALGVPVISSDCRTGPREILKVPLELSFEHTLKLPYAGVFHVNDSSGLMQLLEWMLEFKADEDECMNLVADYGIDNVIMKYKDISSN